MKMSSFWSVDGNPVLVAWGRKRAADVAPDVRIVKSGEAKEPIAQATAPVAAALSGTKAGTAAATAPERVILLDRAPGWLLPSLLWLAFIVTSAAVAYLLLPACAVDLPLVGYFSSTCPGNRKAALSALRRRNESLNGDLQKAETQYALGRSQCKADTGSRGGHVPDRHADAGSPPPPTSEETRRRAEEKGASHGKLDITLSWEGHADLDLHVKCPGGEDSAQQQTGLRWRAGIRRERELGGRSSSRACHLGRQSVARRL